MDLTQRLDWDDEEENSPSGTHRPVGNLHMFAGIHGPAQDFPIYPGPNVIGRHSSCDITLPAQSVSKKHAILDVTGDCHTICDNNSLNKTRRSKVALAPDVRYALCDGDFLLFADVACRYTILKKVSVEANATEESEDDSMLVPGTQATLAIEKTPGAAIRRMGRGAVLAKDSGDEDEDEEVRKGWNEGGEGGSKSALRTSRPTVSALFSPPSDTVVPESDEENDMSSSETHFPSLKLRCDSDVDNLETPAKINSCIPSSLDVFTPPAVKEPSKEESSTLLQINEEKNLGKEQAHGEVKASSAEKDASSDSGLLEERKDIIEGADDKLPLGSQVQLDALDSGLKDGGTNADNCSPDHKNINNLETDATTCETPEVSSTSSHCFKESKEETPKDNAASSSTNVIPDSHTQAEEDKLKSTENDFKVKADLCLDSETDNDDDDEEVPTTSGTEVNKKKDLETKSDKEPEKSTTEVLETSDAGVHMDKDANEDEDKEKTSAVQHGKAVGMNIDSDTDVEDDTEASKTEDAGTRTGDENATEVPEVDTHVSAGLDLNSDTDVDDADMTQSDEKKVDQECKVFVEVEKEQFNLDSDTDVEDNDVSSTKVRTGEFDSTTADVQLKDTKDGIHLDSDTDVEEDVNISSTDGTKGKQALATDVQEGFHMDSDTDAEVVDISTTVANKGKQDANSSVHETREGLCLDSDTDVDENPEPGPSTSSLQSRKTGGHRDNPQSEMVMIEKDVTINKEVVDLHSSSNTGEEYGSSSGETAAEKKPEEGNEAAALQIDSDTDVDEDNTGVSLDKTQSTQEELDSDCVSEGNKASGSSVSETAGETNDPVEGASTVPVDISEEETQKVDTEGDYELMPTQSYLEPHEPESDMPDEEEATQAYILSSTWAEPDHFKRPSDPVGVLQISAVTLDKSEDEVDENAVAETQLFCLDADQSPGPSIKETPEHKEEAMDNQEEVQPGSSVQSSEKEEQQPPPQVAVSQEDTEPVSQYLSTKPLIETGTWVQLKRDVPTSVWMKSLQQEGKEDSTQDNSTQDLLPLELEATQSYILEPPKEEEQPVKDQSPCVLTLQEDNANSPSSPVNLEPATETPVTGPSIPEGSVSAVPSKESIPTGPSTPETDVSKVPSTEIAPTASNMSEMDSSLLSPSAASSVSETSLLPAISTANPPTEPGNLQISVAAVLEKENPPTELNSMETQITDLEVPQSGSLNLPEPENKQEVPITDDATQPCSSAMEDAAGDEAQYSGGNILVVEEEARVTEKKRGRPKKGLSRSKKKEPEQSTEVVNKNPQLLEHASAAIHLAPQQTAKLGSDELEQSGPKIVVSEKSAEIEAEKGGRRRGGRRKATEETAGKTETNDELVTPTASRTRSSRTASETEPSTSGNNKASRKQQSRKSMVTQKEENQGEAKGDFDSASEKSKDSEVCLALSENHSKTKGQRIEDENFIEPTSVEMTVDQMDSNRETNLTSMSLEVSESRDKIDSTSSKNTESEESTILDFPEPSETVSTTSSKKPVRGKRRAATKAKQDNTQESGSNDVEDEKKSDTSGTSDDFKIPISKTSESQDGGQGPSGKTTRRSYVGTKETLDQEKQKGTDTKVNQMKDADPICPDEQPKNRRSIRQQRNVKEEDSQTKEQARRMPSKRAISVKGDETNKEKNSQQTLEENPDTSSIPKRSRKHSREETPEQEAAEVPKTEDDNLLKRQRTRKGNKEDNTGSPESPSTTEAPATRTTRRRSTEQVLVDKKETPKETVTRQRQNSKAEVTQPAEDQIKRSARTRRVSKEETVVEETTKANNKAGQSTSRRTRKTGKAEEQAGDTTPDKSQSERSSSRTRRKASTDDSEKLLGNSEVKKEPKDGAKREDEVHSLLEETPRKGRARKTLIKEEPPQVSTPVASRKRGQASSVDVELKSKKSDESPETAEVKPAARRGRPRKLTTSDDSQTSAGGRPISTPEPSPSRSSIQRQSPASSNLAEVRTPRRTGRLSATALTASPYVPQSGAVPKVLFTGVVDSVGEEIIRSLGGDIADSVYDCTHLVTDRVRRTVKFLCALARGIPIVTLDWIDKCKKSGCFLSHTKFLVKDKEQEKNFNFVLSESLQKAKRKLLFEGYEIHVTQSVKPDPELMKDIICCSGATYLPKMPRTFKEKCVIVSCVEDATRCKSVPSKVPITTAEFILSGILRQEVNPDVYLLSNAAEESAPTAAKRRR